MYPIIYLDFNVGLLIRAENVAERLSVKIKELEQLWGQKTDTKDLAIRFEAVIKSAYEQTGKKVVVLIDEYDKPLINTMNDNTANEEIRTLLKSFYGVLKSADAYLRFVFLTGVTKFSKVSEDIYNPFSLLNTFGSLDFAYYWFATGTPTFLVNALRNQNYDIRKFDNDVVIAADSVMDYRVENQNLIHLLYQTGYLTIKSYK